MEMLSPGVYSQLTDRSQVVPAVSSSTTVFSGQFNKGPVGEYTLITDRLELLDYYGEPDNKNYNDFLQCYTYLGYSGRLLISRAGNLDGKHTAIDGCNLITVGVVEYRDTGEEDDPTTLSVDEGKERFTNYQKVQVSDVHELKVQDIISFGEIKKRYMILEIDEEKRILTLSREIDEDSRPVNGDSVNKVEVLFSGSTEALDNTKVEDITKGENTFVVPKLLDDKDLFETNPQIYNKSEFEDKFEAIAFTSPSAKLKIMAQNPGTWCKNLKICIAKPEDFLTNDYNDDHITHYAFPGIAVDNLFEYAPKNSQIGLIVYDEAKEDIVESFVVDFDRKAVDGNNKSTFIETVINSQSNYIYVKVQDNDNEINSYTYIYDEASESYIGRSLSLKNSADSDIQLNDLLDAYEVFGNKEELDIDIIIANEADNGVSARNLLSMRAEDGEPDCIAIIGAPRELMVGKKSADAVKNLVTYRKGYGSDDKQNLNVNDKYCALFGNYLYVYDRYNDKYRWVNCAGTVAGIRARTSQNYAPWYASAGLERGLLDSTVSKIAFNPNKSQRDMLYKNNINPIVTFPSEGTVIWGQKTLQADASSFDRINVVCLFNTLIRALTKAARHSVFEFNDTYTRNNVLSQLKPYLTNVKTERGIDDYLVVCDESNNTEEVISKNQFVVDIFIRPTFVAEFILLRFTNVGTRSFAEVVNA